MRVKIRTVNTATILDLAGDLIMGESAQVVGGQIRQALEGGAKHLALNLAGVNYIDSCGIGALVRSFTSMQKAGAKCVFFGASRAQLSIFKLAHLDVVFEIVPDEASAVSRLLGAEASGAAA